MLDTADSTFVEAYSSLPNAFTTLIPPNCSSTSVVMFASASLTFKDTFNAFEEKFDASQSTKGIDSITIAPNGRLRVKRVILRINSKNIFAVRHSKTDSGDIALTNVLTGYPAFVDTTSTEDGTKSFVFPDPDPDAKDYDANHVFIIRRDRVGNMFLHNRNGDIIGKLSAKTLELDPTLTNSSDFRTDGDLVLGSIGEVGEQSSAKRQQVYRFGVIESDIGASEAANLAAQLYSLYGGKRSKLTGTSTKSATRAATSTGIGYS